MSMRGKRIKPKLDVHYSLKDSDFIIANFHFYTYKIDILRLKSWDPKIDIDLTGL
jgi:hypothetical protein